MPDIKKPTVADAALRFLEDRRGAGGLTAAHCDELAEMMHTAADESRVLAKQGEALGVALEAAKEVLLRCRAPEGDRAAYDERQRVIGMTEDMIRGTADTAGLRVRWLALAVAKVRGTAPPDRPTTNEGVVPFGRPPRNRRK